MISIDIHRAESHADRCAVVEIGRRAFDNEVPPLGYAAMRLRSAFHQTAEWWLLEDAGRPVASLLSYPLTFGTGEGQVIAGFGLGSVGTLPEARKQGHASRLCERVCRDADEAGRGAGLLFSGLEPRFYERMGFAATPAWNHRCEDPLALAQSGPHADLIPLNPWKEIAQLRAIYEQAHRGNLHLARDDDAWRRSIARKMADDLWFGVGTPSSLVGYARISKWDDGVSVAEVFSEDRSLVVSMMRSVAQLTHEFGHRLLVGWFDPIDELSAFFEDSTRASTLPMVRGFGDALASARFWGSDYF